MRKALVLAAVLAVQVAPPMPGQQPGTASNGPGKATKERQSDKNAANPPITPPSLKANDSSDNSKGVASENKEQSVNLTNVPPITIVEKDKTWKDHLFDWGPWIFNLLLVAVGFLQVALLQRTWATIRRQTEIQEANLIQWADVEPLSLRTQAPVDSDKVPSEVTIIPTWKLVNNTTLPFTVQTVHVEVARKAGWETSEFVIDEVVPPTARTQEYQVFSAPIALTKEETARFLAFGIEFAICIRVSYRTASGKDNVHRSGDMYVCKLGKLEINRPIGRMPKKTWIEEYQEPSTLVTVKVRTLEEETDKPPNPT
jgi:hypothetical protein